MKKVLVLIGIQNDLVTYISQPDYVAVCNKLQSVVRANKFDYIYYYNAFTDNICNSTSLGSNVHWKILELEKFISANQSSTLVSYTKDEIIYPKISFDEPTKVYFAGNLFYINKTIAEWKIKNFAVIPDCVWLARLSWPLVLSMEDNSIDFFKTDSDLTPYKIKYLCKYYSDLKIIKGLKTN